MQLGPFKLIRPLGQGGMGMVFLARQESLDRMVALKVLRADLSQDGRYTQRFVNEARAIGQLVHPNVVQGINISLDPDSGLWYFAMEYVEGETLHDILEDKGRLPGGRVITIGIAMAKALTCASEHDIVHRDIKPENILISRTGEIKLADLGLAKRFDRSSAALTRAGATVGTPFYISPEQAQGKSNQVDLRSDLYSLGCTLFHLLTGQPPYDGPSAPVVMVKHLQAPVPFAHKVRPGVNESLSRLIWKLMQKRPEARFQHPDQLRKALEALRGGSVPPVLKRLRRVSDGTQVAVQIMRRRQNTGLLHASMVRQRPKFGPFLMALSSFALVGLISFAAILLRGPGQSPTRKQIAKTTKANEKKRRARPKAPVHDAPAPAADKNVRHADNIGTPAESHSPESEPVGVPPPRSAEVAMASPAALPPTPLKERLPTPEAPPDPPTPEQKAAIAPPSETSGEMLTVLREETSP